VAPYLTGSNTDFYPDSERNQVVQTLREGALKRVRFSEEIAYDSEKKLEFDQDSFIHAPSKRTPLQIEETEQATRPPTSGRC